MKEHLFSKHDFNAVLNNASEGIKQTVDALPDNELMDTDLDGLIKRLTIKHGITVPTLDLDGITIDEAEVDIDVSRNPSYGFDHDRSHVVKRTEFRFYVPYSGETDVFYCRPSQYSMNFPQAEIRSNEIVVCIIQHDLKADSAAIRKEFDKTISQISEHIDRLRSDASGLEANLKQAATARIIQRRQKRQQDADTASGLGFPKRKDPN
jgi:hypothetical protein